ncbi:hypothetical protein Lser_V15G15151 [Lactuca serriola]
MKAKSRGIGGGRSIAKRLGKSWEALHRKLAICDYFYRIVPNIRRSWRCNFRGDRSRGFTFITMQISGRTVKVNFPEVPRGGEREVMGPNIRSSNIDFIGIPHKIYADNLSWIITSKKLKDTFDEQPGFLSAMVIYEKQSGKSQGFGFVTFSSPEAAEYALNAMNGLEVEGRPLRLNLAEGKGDVCHSTRTGRSSEINVDGSEILSSISS